MVYLLFISFIFSFYRKERLQNDYEKEVRKNFTQQKLDKFKEKNLNRARPPKGYVESVLERLGEAIDTSNMNGIGLSSHLQRIKDPNTVQIWKEVVKEYLTAISTTNTSNIGTSAATPSQSSGSRTASTEQDATEQDENEEDMGNDHHTVPGHK